MEEAAIELAIQGPAYRKAARTLETLLGYRVISHETIRKHLLEASSIPKRESVHQPGCPHTLDSIFGRKPLSLFPGCRVKIKKRCGFSFLQKPLEGSFWPINLS
ncbi:UPF0236 family transposase-like protein [Caldibacillus debilis]|uniref:UPF0236 family transposase-like protein n=1 Tax=Caldibacillus debilis TaxID=301148 RepID=UPI002285D1DB